MKETKLNKSIREVRLDICSKETCLMIEQKLGGTPLENVGYYTKDDDEIHTWNENTPNGICQAFPQAVVIKYLRLYHNIDIITFHELLEKEFWWSRIEKRYMNSLFTEYQQDEEYSSPKESIEEAIKWVYNNILNKEE